MPGTFTMIANPSHRAISSIVKDLGREFRSWRPAFKAMAPFVLRGIDENVRSQGRTIGAQWAPLAASTQRRKARLGRGRGPLIGTGENIADRTSSGSGVTLKITATKMKLGLDGLVANVAHFGRKNGRQPPRRFVDWSPAMEAAALAAMEAHGRRLVAKASARMQAAAAGGIGRARDGGGRFVWGSR